MTYAVREQTRDPDDPPVVVVALIETVLQRASSLREDCPAVSLARTAVEETDRDAIAECIKLIILDELTHRQAGARTFVIDRTVRAY